MILINQLNQFNLRFRQQPTTINTMQPFAFKSLNVNRRAIKANLLIIEHLNSWFSNLTILNNEYEFSIMLIDVHGNSSVLLNPVHNCSKTGKGVGVRKSRTCGKTNWGSNAMWTRISIIEETIICCKKRL